MLSFLFNWIYSLLTRSGIVLRLPLVSKLVFMRLIFQVKKEALITDDGGAAMRVTEVNGKRFPPFGKQCFLKMKDVMIRDNDVLLCGYPKTGCHWVYEILAMLRNGKAELSSNGKGIGMLDAMPNIILDSVPSPRVLNSHVLYEDLPTGIIKNKTKIILTIRNPKDVVVSYYNHTINLSKFYGYSGEFQNYFKMFMKGAHDYGSYFDFYQSWHKVMNQQTANEIFFLKYEDLKRNPLKKVMELATFLDIKVTPEFAQEVIDVASFSNMKSKRASPIFRKGKVGDWENWLTPEQADEIDTLWEKKLMPILDPVSQL